MSGQTAYVGLVDGAEPGVVAAAVIDDAGRDRGTASFEIPPAAATISETTGLDYAHSPGLDELETFLRWHAADNGAIGILVEVPATVTDDELDDGRVPNGVVPSTSSVLPVVLHLAARGFITLRVGW